MGRKERRKQQRIKKKDEKSNNKYLSSVQQQKIKRKENLKLTRNAMLVSISATLLAVKDEKGLSKEMTIRIMNRINSILEEFNNGSKGRLQEILDVVQDELNFNLKEI